MNSPDSTNVTRELLYCHYIFYSISNFSNLAVAGKFSEAAAAYAAVHDLFMWDSRKEFIQAIKLAMDIVGRYGGPTRLPRLPLPAADEVQCRKDIAKALAFYSRK